MANETTQVQAEVQAKEIVQNVVKAEGIQAYNTTHGDVVFINTNYVSQKFIDLCLRALESEIFETTIDTSTGATLSNGHGVFSVVFRLDGQPTQLEGESWEPVTWMYYPGARSAVCNLKFCVQKAIEDGLNEENKHAECMNVRHAVWQHMLSGFIHETCHSSAFVEDYEGLLKDAGAQEAEEERADEYARMFLFEMAKQYDIEPDLGAPMERLIAAAMTILDEIEADEKPSDREKAFLTCQKYLAQTGDSWFAATEDEDKENHVIKRYKEFLHFVSGDPMDDESWAIEPVATNTVAVVGTPVACNETAAGTPADGVEEYYEDDDYGTGEPVTPGFGGVQAQATGWGGTPMTAAQPVQPVHNTQHVYQPAQNAAPMAPSAPVAPSTPVAPPMAPAPNNVQVNPGAGAYQAPAMNIGAFQATIKGLYLKIAQHIFQSCGYNPSYGPGQPFFMQATKIVDQLPLTPEEGAIVKEMECYNAQGQKMQGVPVQGWISGVFIDKAQCLPGYVLTMTDPMGNQIQRKLIPQNPWKVKYGTQEYSSTALDAQQGNHIMWVIDPNAVDKKMATRVINGVLQSNASGSWQAVC